MLSREKFRDTQLSTKEIAGKLGVKSILEGGVQRAGGRVRVNVQLIDADSDAHLWAESYDRELTAANIFAIQSEVAAAIAGALKAALTPAEKDRAQAVPTLNLAAWESYQLGRQRQAKRTSEAMAEALDYFETAIELDPRFALAYVAVAEALMLQVGYSGAPNEGTYARANEAIEKALELDPKDSTAACRPLTPRHTAPSGSVVSTAKRISPHGDAFRIRGSRSRFRPAAPGGSISTSARTA